MSSLADRPELVGFFSYSRRDDEHSQGALSRLRARIQSELRLQLGRDFRLWQDTAAIPDGALWEGEIKRAIAESVFFIPIVTPSAVGSEHCRFEFQSFLDRESELGRNDLIFPILYIRVAALESEAQWRQDALLKIIGDRQYTNWQQFRHRDVTSPEFAARDLRVSRVRRSFSASGPSKTDRRMAEMGHSRRFCPCATYVRFPLNSDRMADILERQLRARSRHLRCSRDELVRNIDRRK